MIIMAGNIIDEFVFTSCNV